MRGEGNFHIIGIVERDQARPKFLQKKAQKGTEREARWSFSDEVLGEEFFRGYMSYLMGIPKRTQISEMLKIKKNLSWNYNLELKL